MPGRERGTSPAHIVRLAFRTPDQGVTYRPARPAPRSIIVLQAMHVISLGVHATVYYRHVLRLLPGMGGRFSETTTNRSGIGSGKRSANGVAGNPYIRPPAPARPIDKPARFPPRNPAGGIARPAWVCGLVAWLARITIWLPHQRDATPAVTGQAGCRLSAPNQPVSCIHSRALRHTAPFPRLPSPSASRLARLPSPGRTPSQGQAGAGLRARTRGRVLVTARIQCHGREAGN